MVPPADPCLSPCLGGPHICDQVQLHTFTELPLQGVHQADALVVAAQDLVATAFAQWHQQQSVQVVWASMTGKGGEEVCHYLIYRCQSPAEYVHLEKCQPR